MEPPESLSEAALDPLHNGLDGSLSPRGACNFLAVEDAILGGLGPDLEEGRLESRDLVVKLRSEVPTDIRLIGSHFC